MKKVYDDLTIINLYIRINFLFSDWTQFLQPIWDSINLSNNVSRLNKNRNKNAKVANLSRPQTLNLHRASREEQGHYLAVESYMATKDLCSFYMGTIRTKWPLCRYESKLFFTSLPLCHLTENLAMYLWTCSGVAALFSNCSQFSFPDHSTLSIYIVKTSKARRVEKEVSDRHPLIW